MRWETELSIPIHCFLFDAAIFREHGISFDESLPNHVDWECWMSVFALNPGIIYIDRPLAYYRMRSDSLCRNRPMMRQGYLMAIDKQIQKHKNNREVMEKMNIRKRQIQYLYRDVSPLVRKMESCNPLIRKVYQKIVPWRMQRIFD